MGKVRKHNPSSLSPFTRPQMIRGPIGNSAMTPRYKYFSWLLLWPLCSVLLVAGSWIYVSHEISHEQTDLRAQAIVNVEALADAYSKQMLRSLEKIDDLTAIVKFFWEDAPNPLDLNKLHTRGVFSTNQFALLIILDENGDVKSSTIPINGRRNFADRPHFIHHRDNPSDAIWIGTPTIGKILNRPVIQLSRRLNHRDGSFGGDLVAGMTSDFFTPLTNGALFGKGSAQILIGDDNVVRVALLNNVLRVADVAAFRPGPNCLYTEQATRLDSECFSDHQARYVAMKRLGIYPYTALVGLSEHEILAPSLLHNQERSRFAWFGTLLIAIFGSVGFALTSSLLRRNADASQIRMAYRLATENGKDGFYLYQTVRDANGLIIDFRIVDCNEQAAKFVGLTKEKIIGTTFADYYGCTAHYESLVSTYRRFYELGEGEDDYEVPPSSILDVEWMRRKFVRTVEGLAVTMQDISDKVKHDQEMVRLANEDLLTKLPNRNWLMHSLPAMLTHARQKNTRLAVLFVDLNNFKTINDTLGHSVGDEVLSAAADRLTSLVRPHDHVARLGGDEFTILLRHIDSDDTVEQAAFRIADGFRRPLVIAQGERRIGVSIGIALFPKDGLDASTLLKHADIAMYAAKVGKEPHSFYEHAMSAVRQDHLALVEDLITALEQDQFQMYYQPRINTVTGHLVGMEALIRWISPTRGFVAPDQFIPIAENTDLILQIGEVVANKVAKQIRQWIDADIKVVPISVNVSAKQFNTGNVSELFKACLHRFDLPAHLLEVELTESAMMGDYEIVAHQLAMLDAIGVKTHVDDFGTGYSSLALLQSLSLDVLKIDRAFTANLGIRADSEILFQAIIVMAHSLGMTVIAEGVETQQQLAIARRMACDEVQGYLISKPVPANDAEAFLRAGQPLYLIPTIHSIEANGHPSLFQ